MSNENRTFRIPFWETDGNGFTVSFTFVKAGELHQQKVPVYLRRPDKKLTIRTETFRDIHEARDGRSIVIISHQERIIQLADEIVLLRDGRVERTGTPEELMPQLGFVSKGIPGCRLSEPTELHLTEIPTTC